MNPMKKLLSSDFIAMMLISSLSIFIGVQPSFAENKAIDPSQAPKASFWFAPSKKKHEMVWGTTVIQ